MTANKSNILKQLLKENKAVIKAFELKERVNFYKALNSKYGEKIIFSESGNFAVWYHNGITVNLLNNNMTEILINLYGYDFKSMDIFVRNNGLNMDVLDLNY